jgi:hypothetical protein
MTTAKNIGRKRKKNGFTQISNLLFEDSNLSWKAKGILCYLLSRPNNWKINKTDLENRAAEGRESVHNGIKELKKLGYLHIYPNRLENGQIDGWIWEYDDIPFTPEIRENRNTDNPQKTGENVLVSQITVKPNDGLTELRETRIYNNTDFNNTEYNNTEGINDLKNSPKKAKKNSSSAELESEFELLWAKYPRKIGKSKALQSYIKARKVKKYAYEQIEIGLNKYLEYLETNGTEEQYIQHGSTWFNQENFLSEYEATHFQKKPQLSRFNQMMVNQMENPDDFLNLIGVSEVDERRNRKILDMGEVHLS